MATDAKGSFPVCDLRGWGHLTGKGVGALGLDHDLAVEIQDANAFLIAAAPDMFTALKAVNKLISEAAMTGFNCHDGDWAERLFHSQQATSAAIKRASTVTSTPRATPVMQAAENAAKVVEGWSDSKKEYADRAMSPAHRGDGA